MTNQTQLQQSSAEILRVFTDWKSFYAPANLLDNERTADLLVDYVVLHHAGIVSFTALNAAVEALGEQVLKPEPKKLTIEEQTEIFQKKEYARIQKETAENAIPFTGRVKAEKAKREQEAWVKGQNTAKNELNTIISEYSCSRGPDRIDHTASGMVREFLGKVRVPATAGKGIDTSRTDYIATALWVKAIKEALPDHPVLGDCEKAMQRVRDKFAAQAEAKKLPNKHNAW